MSNRTRRDSSPLPSSRTQSSNIAASVRNAVTLALHALREIFDESAYQRFLRRTMLPSSPASYAAFLNEQQTLKARRPRCC